MIDPDSIADGLTEQAVELCLGWFSFGGKATINSSPPHANVSARREGLDDLVARGYVTHEHDAARDVHTYRGSASTAAVKRSARGRATASRLLGVSL